MSMTSAFHFAPRPPRYHQGVFVKRASSSPVITRTGAGTAEIKAGTVVAVGETVLTLAAATPILMPVLTPGTDYAVYVCKDGTVRADTSFSAPHGYGAADCRRIGGFHHDLGSSIGVHSLWDLNWRPACPDPRGMVLVGGAFWADIYLLGTDHIVNGTSRAAVTIADGASPPKIAPAFGGTGASTYGSFNWWEANEVMTAHGKRLPCCGEFAALAYGVIEGASRGSDPVTTQRDPGRTSAWGVEQAAGVMWVWGADLSYWPGTGTAGYKASTGGRGALYLANDRGLVAAVHGGSWTGGANAGSRASDLSGDPWTGAQSIGARGIADHLNPGGMA